MAITIKDIAKSAGVSVSTVSQVLNGRQSRISEATRQKVLKTAKEMQYRPNRLAASLITKRTRTIGLIVPDITNSFFSRIAAAVQSECVKADYSVMLCSTNDMPEQDVRYVNLLLERNVDGVLFVMAVNSKTTRADDCLRLLQQADVPVILLDREWQGSQVNVMVDNEQGGYLACRHLLEQGHRKIGCLSGSMGTQSAQQRLYGYIRAIQEYGLKFDPKLVVEGNYHTNSGYQMCDKLLQQNVSAIFACNDMMALGVYQRLRERGLTIPKDISVVGYDNLEFTEFLEVPLTTVTQPAETMGTVSAQKLLNILNGTKEYSIVYTPQLVVRASTAAPGEKTAKER